MSINIDINDVEVFPISMQNSAEKMVKKEINNICPICIDEFKENQLTVHLCCSDYHVFHLKCLESYLDYRQDCPMCKQGIDVDKITFERHGQGKAPGLYRDEFLIKFRENEKIRTKYRLTGTIDIQRFYAMERKEMGKNLICCLIMFLIIGAVVYVHWKRQQI